MSTIAAKERLAQLQAEYAEAYRKYTQQRLARTSQAHCSAYGMPVAACTDEHFAYLLNTLNTARNRVINQRAAMGLEYIGV